MSMMSSSSRRRASLISVGSVRREAPVCVIELFSKDGAWTGHVREGRCLHEMRSLIVASAGFGAVKYRPDLLHLAATNGKHCTDHGHVSESLWVLWIEPRREIISGSWYVAGVPTTDRSHQHCTKGHLQGFELHCTDHPGKRHGM